MNFCKVQIPQDVGISQAIFDGFSLNICFFAETSFKILGSLWHNFWKIIRFWSSSQTLHIASLRDAQFLFNLKMGHAAAFQA